jgi:hypothetical protein
MPGNKTKLQNYLSLFIPSALGMVFYVFLAGLTIVLNQFNFIKHFLELPQSLQVSRAVAGWADKVLTTTIGESRTEALVVGLFWALVGLVVYMFLRGLARFIIELDDDISVRRYVWPKGADRYRPLRILAEQAVFRLSALIALAIVIFGPLAAVLSGPVFIDFIGDNQVLQYVIWFLTGVLLWHIIVILLRLLALRARLLG